MTQWWKSQMTAICLTPFGLRQLNKPSLQAWARLFLAFLQNERFQYSLSSENSQSFLHVHVHVQNPTVWVCVSGVSKCLTLSQHLWKFYNSMSECKTRISLCVHRTCLEAHQENINRDCLTGRQKCRLWVGGEEETLHWIPSQHLLFECLSIHMCCFF